MIFNDGLEVRDDVTFASAPDRLNDVNAFFRIQFKFTTPCRVDPKKKSYLTLACVHVHESPAQLFVWALYDMDCEFFNQRKVNET